MATSKIKVGEVHETGLWWDSIAGKVVTSPPVEGRQIVAPGVEVTNAEAAMHAYFSSVDEPDKEVATLTTKEARKG